MFQISKERLYEVLRNPLITEKSTQLSSVNQVVFEISKDATKKEVAAAIETLFKVKVKKVLTLNQNGKIKVFKGKTGKRNNYKKAIVTLEAGQNIDLATGVK